MNNTAPQRDVYEIVTDRIIDQLEQGFIPWRKSWVEGGLPQNLITRKPYRGINVMLLTFQQYPQNLYLTFKQVQALGARVKKGEKSHLVVFWKTNEKGEPETGEKKQVPYLQYHLIFNISQCEGIPVNMIPPITRRENNVIESCEKVIEGMPQSPRIKHTENRAYYSPIKDIVNVPKKESFDDAESYYGTLFHELVHSTGHKKRLNRKGSTEMAEFGSDSYSFEELVAEIGASYLNSHCGTQESLFTNNEAYLQGWLTKLKSDKRFIVIAAVHAQKATDFILNKISEETDSDADEKAAETVNGVEMH